MTEARDDGSAIGDVGVTYLESAHVGEDYKILVAGTSPEDPTPPGQVFVVTDANHVYGTALEMARMYRFGGWVPPLLVVGIGYRATYFPETRVRRTRDLTPVPTSAGEGRGGGGAAAFLDFIDEELKPFLSERYGTGSAEFALYGMSLGGLFATWVLLTRPGAFRRYGIGSPSCWWGGHDIMKTEAAYAASHDDLAARVFVGVGARENPGGELHAVRWLPADERAEAHEKAEATPVDMVADAALLANRLHRRGYPSLELEHRAFPDEYHLTVGGVNLSWSLRSLYDAPR
jgi:uncharacterized protein